MPLLSWRKTALHHRFSPEQAVHQQPQSAHCVQGTMLRASSYISSCDPQSNSIRMILVSSPLYR